MPRKSGSPEDDDKKRAKTAKKTTAFDIWLDRGLHQTYGWFLENHATLLG